MAGYHELSDNARSTLDDRNKADGLLRAEEEVDTEFSKMCAHNDDWDPLGEEPGAANL
jgi:hypothetical protein